MPPGYILTKPDGTQEVVRASPQTIEWSEQQDPTSFEAAVAVGPLEILASLETQVALIAREPCSPAESKLINALAVLIAVVRHIHGPQPGDQVCDPGFTHPIAGTYTVR